MLRISLYSAVAALALLVAPLAPASAGQVNTAPTHQVANSHAFSLFGSADALSLNTNSISQGNVAVGKKVFQDNFAPDQPERKQPCDRDRRRRQRDLGQHQPDRARQRRVRPESDFQINRAPTTQSATSSAVSIGGDASAVSANSNGVSQGNSR